MKDKICSTCIKYFDPCDELDCNQDNGWKLWRIHSVPSHADMVKNPEHYTAGAVECIDAIRSALSPDEFRAYCKGTIIKYIWREKHKNKDEDILKGAQYMSWLIAEIEKKDK